MLIPSLLDDGSKRWAETHSKHIRTYEDWCPTLTPYQKSPNHHPNFNNPLDHSAVCVSVIEMDIEKDNYRVCVWGADDFGLEKDYLTRIEAFKLYNWIKDFTTQAQLRKAGFNNA